MLFVYFLIHIENSDIVLQQSPLYNSTILKIQSKIQSDFMKAKEYSKTFEVVKPIYKFEKEWDFTTFKKNATNLSTIKKGIQSTRVMEKTLTNLRVAYTIGNITVETRDLKKQLMPTIASIMNGT